MDRARRFARSRRFRLSIRLIGGCAVLVAVVAHVGTGPVLHGLVSVDGPTIGAAAILAAIATAAASWRWRLVAGRLGVELRWSHAIAMYYQSQFLNMVLPGGVIGDVHRAVAHGRSAGSIGRATRAVAIERSAGQLMQLTLTLLILGCLGAELNGHLTVTIAIGVAVLVVTVLVVTVIAAFSASAHVRMAVRHELAELRAGLGSVRVSAQVAVASVIVIACHAMTFAIAAADVGASVPALQLFALTFVILLGASIPLNIGGWGPREGIAGWAFASVGFGATSGVAASTLFGVLAIISVAPGAVVTVVFAARRRKAAEATLTSEPAALPDQPRILVLTSRTSRQERTS